MDTDLIMAVQNCPALYDKNDENYFNRTYLNNKWRQISSELGLEAQTARKKWTQLRDYFQKQQRRMTALKSEPGCHVVRKWHLYDAMSFLIPHVKERDREAASNSNANGHVQHQAQSLSMLLSPDDGTCTQSQLSPPTLEAHAEEPDSEGRYTPTPDDHCIGVEHHATAAQEMKRKSPCFPVSIQTNGVSDLDLQMLRTIQEMGHKVSNTKDHEAADEDELFCRSLIPKMRRIHGVSKAECQLKVQKVIVKYLRLSTKSANKQI